MAVAPKFNATIDADISKFMKKLATVDQKIREAASGAIVDIGADISGFMRRAATVESTISDINRDNPTIIINADTQDFTRATREVNSQTNALSRRITEAQIGADIGSFENKMVDVMRALTDANDTVTPRIEADITEFSREIMTVQSRMREIARSTANPQVEADIAGFMAQMSAVQAQLDIVTREHDIDIRADTGGAQAKIAALWLQIKGLTARDFVVNIRASWANYQAVMGAMATFSRNFAEIVGMTARGITIAMSPAIVPVLSSVVGLLGQLGPMLGTIGGSAFALVTSFGAAGLGAAGFAAVAIPSIKKVTDTAGELKDIEEKMAKADTWKERNKLMKEQSAILNGMSKAQAKASEALNAFKTNYAALVKDMETPVLNVFASALTGVTSVLDLARPMIENVTTSVQNLMDSFNANLEAADVKAFFGFLKDYAGPALETIGKAVGNFTMGLFNMMEAFGPLSTETQNGFLSMSESFRSWSASLSESKAFQSFVNYVSENMPKIRSIFSDAINGVIMMFSAFGDSSSDMMTKLAEMMEGFLEWSRALGESEGFKGFIDYVTTNGPMVLSVIGELVDFIINLGKAASGIGESMLAMVDSVLNFTNGVLEAHPWVGKLGVAMVVMGGLFMAVLPTIVGLNALLGGLITKMILMTAKTVWAATTSVANWILMGVTATLNAIKVAAAWTLSAGIQMVTAVARTTASVVLIIAQWLLMGAQAALHAAKVAAAWLLTTGAAMVTAVASMTVTAALFVAKWTLMAVQSLAQAARMAAAWLIAMGPIGWAIAAVAGLAVIIIANWDKISDWTSKTWTKVSDWIKEKWEEIKTKTTEAATNIWNTVKDKFTSIVNSVKEKMTSAKETISTKWEEAKSATINKIASIVSAVTTKFSEIVSKVKAKMSEAKTALSNKWEEAKSATSSKLSSLVSTVTTFFSQVVSKVREKMSEAVRVLGQKVGEMPGKVKSFVGEMLSAGGDLVRGLIDGIKNMSSAAIDAISGVVGGVINKAKSLLNINSPSRVFSEFGGFVSEGLANGVSDKAKLAVDSVGRMANDMTNAFAPNFATQSINMEMNRMDYGSELDSLSAQVKRELSVDMNVKHSGGISGGTQPSTGEPKEIVLMIDGYELARVQRDHLDGMNGNKLNLVSAMKG